MTFTEFLKKQQFNVIPRKTLNKLSDEILNRYKNIPPDFIDFLQSFQEITNAEENTWFISIEEYNNEPDTAFAWNEFEQMSMEAAEDDEQLQQEIRVFWDNHFPFLLSVETYQYLAIRLTENGYGEIVHGIEPEFEDAATLYGNFNLLLAELNFS